LDFGCGTSFLGLAAAEAGYDVLGYDRSPVTWAWSHPRLSFRMGDILNDQIDAESFDLVMNCSAIEHVGLAGRYGAETNVDNGDLLAMRRLFDSMKPDGLMLLTIPVGRDAVFEPMTRIYGSQRLPRLLDGFEVTSETYWVKDPANQWIQCDHATALAFEAFAESNNPLENCYGLGCIKLQKPPSAESSETE
jgi:SAM-dependent methyltransferase